MATLRQLKAFVITAEYKKMSEAARHLFISQPTVSQIISELEKEYGTTLFERHARELQITPAGMLLLENARQIIAIHETLEQNMKTINASRPLRIGATMTIGSNIMGKIISGLNASCPDIDTFVMISNTRQIEQMLVENTLDIALVEGTISRDQILTRPALTDSLCIICSNEHPLANRDTIMVSELRNQNFILREQGSGTRAIFENLMQSHHIPYKIKWESTSTPAIIDAVTYNLGLGFLSERSAGDSLADGSVHKLPVQEVSLNRYFYLCYNRFHPVTSQMQDFINYIDKLPADFQ